MAVPAAPISFASALAELDTRDLRRQRRTVRRGKPESAEIELDGRRCVDFCSNDYLGLAAHPQVVEAFIDAARIHGVGARAAWATDTDPQALLATRANAVLNGVTERLTVDAPEDLRAPAVDVLVANILARPLIALAPTLAARARPGGHLVLAGILERQADDVTAAYAPYFVGFERAREDGWVRLAAVRNAS